MKFQFRSWKSLTLVVLGFSVISSPAVHAAQVKGQAPEAVPGEFLIGYQNEASLLSAKNGGIEASVAQLFGRDQILSIETLSDTTKVQRILVKENKKLSGIIDSLRNLPGVRYVEPNYIYRTLSVPNDPEFARQWDMVNTGQLDRAANEATPTNPGQLGVMGNDVNVLPLWDRGNVGSRNVVVAIIDTGIDYNHPDLAANIYTNPNEIPGNGIDDDHNGIIDDVHGANFSGASPVGNGLDDHDHGTHCAGTIGAIGNNGIGIAGVNWEVTMMPVKFLTADGSGSAAGALQSIHYARQMGANVMSNSWGGGGFSQALFDAIKEARDAGILFVAAAGNESNDNDAKPSYPASYQLDNVVSVAATDNRDVMASFSNFGKNTVHVAAPGKNILSTVRNGGYKTFSGTSMACPHVSGMAALLWSTDQTLTYSDIKARLIQTSTPVRGLRSGVLAKGRVHMNNAFQNYVPPSNEPNPSAWVKQSYKAESVHPYAVNANDTYEISVPGARNIRVIFEKFETESGYDTVSIENSKGEVSDKISGSKNGYVSEYIEGDKLILRLASDYSETAYGFKISEIEVIR